MFAQEKMIERVREICSEDDYLISAMMYGSFAKRKGDAYSDIEFVLFFNDEYLEKLDRKNWLEQIAPIEIFYVNEFGVTAVVFQNLVRGEFHFYKISDVSIAETWEGTVSFARLEDTLIVDKKGDLKPYLEKLINPEPSNDASAEYKEFVVNSFFNWYIFGINLLKRKDFSHALNILWMVQRYLLSIVRIVEGKVENLPSPTKSLKEELSEESYERYIECTSKLSQRSLEKAYLNCLNWAKELLETNTEIFSDSKKELIQKIYKYFRT